VPYAIDIRAEASTNGWYRVTYDGVTGWISGDYLTYSESCGT
jgi:uncharacterized protein YgiM (DUF1202 family)